MNKTLPLKKRTTTPFEEAVGGGMGAFRLRTEYEDEFDDEDDRQRIRIEPIYDADMSVYFDIDAKKYDKSDSKYAFVLTSMTVDAFIDEWGEDPSSWPRPDSYNEFEWCSNNTVYVAEYYVINETSEKVYIYQPLQGGTEKYTDSDFDNDPELKKRLRATQSKLVKTKKVKRRVVNKYIFSGSGVLEDCGVIAGKNIPIIPVYGKRWYVDNIERYMGHVRLAKDSQRLYNMQLSKLAEISGQSTVEKPIFTPKQVAGHENNWATDNVNNYAYQLVNKETDAAGNEVPAGPVGYTRAPNIPPAMGALIQQTGSDMQEVLGNPQDGEKIQANVSTETVAMVQERLDMQTFIYMSNLAKSMKRCGEIWLDIAKEIYVEKDRRLKGVGGQDEVSSIQLKQPKLIEKTGETILENDLSKASFSVAVNVGPSYTSKKNAIVSNLTAMLQRTQDPETIQVLTNMIMMNMEGEGIEEMRDFYRQKMIRLGVVKPTPEELQELNAEAQNQQPSANDKYLEAASLNEEAKAAKSRADTVLTLAQVEETKSKADKNNADILETISDIEVKDAQQKLDVFNSASEVLQTP